MRNDQQRARQQQDGDKRKRTASATEHLNLKAFHKNLCNSRIQKSESRSQNNKAETAFADFLSF
jgi:hypothetical protein